MAFLPKDVAYAHAVQLASAFIANGDIRLNQSTRDDNASFDMLSDLIATLYVRVQDDYKRLANS